MGYRFDQDIEIDYNYIFSNIAIELFSESNPTGRETDGEPLGDLALMQTINLTSWTSSPDGVTTLEPYMIPILGCYGLIEELYMGLSNQARRIDQGGHDWPLILKAICLPASDKVFSVRNDRLPPLASAIYGKKVLNRFEQLVSLYGIPARRVNKMTIEPLIADVPMCS
jgi:hypothetical protein